MAEKSLRIRTNVFDDSVVRVNLQQDIDFLEILSLKLNQKSHYVRHTSNYGIIVGRVLANEAFGVPNCKVSVFIPLSEDDKADTKISSLYPYATVYSKDNNNVRYNLLPNDSDDECHRVVGTFPTKRYVLDNESIIEVFDKYYKYTTVTNNAGDYMICGVPANTSATVHVDIDFSDIGILSQSPRDMVEQGYTLESFDSSSQFKYSTNLDDLVQIQSQTKTIDVKPFWGDSSEIAINRCDIQINYKFEPKCIFIGSILTDNNDSKIGHKCTPSKGSGLNSKIVASKGTIEMIRKTVDGFVEEFPINANQLVDEDGVWCYQIPMNLDYIGTDEFGNIIRVENPNKGIPTRTSVRFRFTLAEDGASTKHRARYLVPNNPKIVENLDGQYVFPHVENGQSFNNVYEFGTATPDDCFRDLYWNKVYSVKNYIPRLQTARRDKTRQYSALKSTNLAEGVNQVPFNKIRTRLPFAYSIVCILCKILINLIYFINRRIICFLDKLKIIKWYFFKIGCISFNLNVGEDNEGNVVFVPGCNCSRGQNLTDCPDDQKTCEKVWDKGTILDTIQQTLSEEYDVANLDFYNDWLNGSLYFPLWFWKKTPTRRVFFIFKVKARNWFCSCSRKFKKLKLVESCAVKFKYKGNNVFKNGLQYTGKDKDAKWHKEMSKHNTVYGFIKEFTNKKNLNIYYYACGMPNKENYESDPNPVGYLRLYSTDIILLGSMNTCSMDGLPRFFDKLSSTSANNPEIAAIIDALSDEDTVDINNNSEKVISLDGDSEQGMIEQSGMDWTSSGKKENYQRGLFFDLGCNTVKTRIKTCANVGRLCELGMTYDQTYSIESVNNGTIQEDVYEADGMVTRLEIDDNESRAMFASMNANGFLEKVVDENTSFNTYKLEYMYPVDLDGKLFSYSKQYSSGRKHRTYDNFDASYLKFRLGKTAHFYDDTFPLYENSFYFYFGMKEGSSAIDKFRAKYDAECYQIDKIPFSMDINTESARFCPRTPSGDGKSDYALIEVSLNGIRKPYSYTLMDETGFELMHEKNMYLDTLVFGAEVDDSDKDNIGYKITENGSYVKDCYLWYNNPESYDSELFDKEKSYVRINNEKICIKNGSYIISVVDAREKSVEREITIGPTYLSMDISVSSLGVKYHGYSSSGETEEQTSYTYNFADKLPSLAINLPTTDPFDSSELENPDDEAANSTTILFPQDESCNRELNTNSSILQDVSRITHTENNNYGIDEKSYICGNGKAGRIIIDKIYIDGTPCEIVWIQDHYPTDKDISNLTLYDLASLDTATPIKVLNGLPKAKENDVYGDGDFFCVVSDDSQNKIEGNMFKFVKLHLGTLKEGFSFKDCCCNYDDIHQVYDLGIEGPTGKNGDFWASFDGKEDDWLKYERGVKPLSGGIWQHGDFDVSTNREDPHVHFDIWVPGDYEISITEYCGGELSQNVSMDTVTVENGGDFIVNINDVPMQFLLGVAEKEEDYNHEFFNPSATTPGNLVGWFKVHLPNAYRFPSTKKKDFELWSNFVDPMYGENSDFTRRMKAEVLMYKLDSMFKMSKNTYVTSEDLVTQFTSSEGGQKPILYIGAYPSFEYEAALGDVIVDTIGATDVPDVWPNIVGSNYKYTVEGKTSIKTKNIKVGNTNNLVSISNSHLYNGLTTGYYGAKDPFFNPQLTNHDKDIVIGVTEGSKYLEKLGNYFAAFTLNAGKTNTDINGKCRWSEDNSGKTISFPIGASAYTLCAGQEQILTGSSTLGYPEDIVKHYFRVESVDRRLDYDMFLYMPPSTKFLPNLQPNRTSVSNKSKTNSLWNKGRIYGTVYNGIEMAYDKTYNVIGKDLEYEYDIDSCQLASKQNFASTSKNRRFYRSYIKTDTLKNDINDLYYSGYHTPSSITSLQDFLNAKDENIDEVKCAPLNGVAAEDFSFINEVNGDFSFDNYPTKRTINIFNIQPCSKLEFNVTSCSYNMESGLLGEDDYDINNAKYSSVSGMQEDTEDIASGGDENNFTITARTQEGEECTFTLDTRDNCKPNSNNSDLDFVTSWDTVEVRYRSKALNLLYDYKTDKMSLDSANPYAMCYFDDDRPYDLNLKFSIGQDIYCEDHDTYTSTPFVVNLLERPLSGHTRLCYKENITDSNFKNWIGDTTKLVYENPMDLALSGTTPTNIMDNIRTVCRAQYMEAQEFDNNVIIQSDISKKPISSKFDNSYIYQINENKYFFLTDTDNPDSNIVLDNTNEAEDIKYHYGYYSTYRHKTWFRKAKTKHYSDWQAYFTYNRKVNNVYARRKQYFQYKLASVIGIIYERNYINTNNDNLGKNIKMLKLSHVIDLRPILVTLESTQEGEIIESATTIPTVLANVSWQERDDEFNGRYFRPDIEGEVSMLAKTITNSSKKPRAIFMNLSGSTSGTTPEGKVLNPGVEKPYFYSGTTNTMSISDIQSYYDNFSFRFQANVIGSEENDGHGYGGVGLETCMRVLYNGRDLLGGIYYGVSADKTRLLSLVYGITPKYVKYFTNKQTASGGDNTGVFYPYDIKASLARINTFDATMSVLGRYAGGTRGGYESFQDISYEFDSKRFALEYWPLSGRVGGRNFTIDEIKDICCKIANISKEKITLVNYNGEHSATAEDWFSYKLGCLEYDNICDYINEKLKERSSDDDILNGISVVHVKTWTNYLINARYTSREVSEDFYDITTLYCGEIYEDGKVVKLNSMIKKEKFPLLKTIDSGLTVVLAAPNNSAWMTLYNGSGRTIDDCLVESASFNIDNDPSFTSHKATLLSADELHSGDISVDEVTPRNYVGIKIDWSTDTVPDVETNQRYKDKFSNETVKASIVLKMKNGLHHTLLLKINPLNNKNVFFGNFE